MKKGSRNTILFVILFMVCFNKSFSQDYKLYVKGKDSLETKFLSKLDFNRDHQTKESAFSEIDSLSNVLINEGYINSTFQTSINKFKIYCTFKLNVKVDSLLIAFNENDISEKLRNEISRNNSPSNFIISHKDVDKSLNKIVSHFEKIGYPFATARLQNFIQNNNFLKAELFISKNNRRNIDKIIINGYKDFPNKFKKHYFKLDKNQIFNSDLIIDIEKKIKSLSFVQQIKKPEILFSKDSTLLYVYLKKRSQSAFDGIVGFSNEDTGKLKFNGYLNLHLSNTFNKGEIINLEWKNSKDLNNQLKLSSSIPYIFNSRLKFLTDFSIYKQDSTFLNTKTNLQLSYPINIKNSVQFIYEFENSNITNDNDSNLTDFTKNLIGVSYSYLPSTQEYSKHTFELETGILYGNRKTLISENQSKIFIDGSYSYNLNTKSFIQIKNRYAQIDNSNLLQNELFRIGGINSVRGFNEESIYAKKYNITQLEYHLKLASNFSIFSITDFALYNNPISKKQSKIYSLGLGVNTNIQTNSFLSIIYAIGKPHENRFNLKNSKFHIKINYSI